MVRHRIALTAALALAAGMAQAQPPALPLPPVPTQAPPSADGTLIPAGTPLSIQVAEMLDSQVVRRGQRFRIRLGTDLKVGAVVVLPAGTPGEGEVIDVDPASRGQPGKLHIAARFLVHEGRRIPLKGLRMQDVGQVSADASQGFGAITFTDIGYPAAITPGERGVGELAADVRLSRNLGVTLPAPLPPARTTAGIPGGFAPPPAGKGQIIFVRPKSPLAYMSGIKLYEGEIGDKSVVIGTVGNGRVLQVDVDPGPHVISAYGTRPDSLRFEVEPGEVYYVVLYYQRDKPSFNPVLYHADRAEFADYGVVPDKAGKRR
jgi:hypothetical protein